MCNRTETDEGTGIVVQHSSPSYAETCWCFLLFRSARSSFMSAQIMVVQSKLYISIIFFTNHYLPFMY